MKTFIRYFNERVKRLTIWDLKLIQGAAMILAVIIVQLIPSILDIERQWFLLALAIVLIRPAYAFYFKA